MTEFKRWTMLRRLAENTLARFGECLDYFHAGKDWQLLASRLERLHDLWPEAKEYETGARYMQSVCGFAGQVLDLSITVGEVCDLDRVEAVVINRLPPIRFLGRQYSTAFEAATSLGPVLCYCARGTFTAAAADPEYYVEATYKVYSVVDPDCAEYGDETCNELMAEYRDAVQDLKVRLAQEWQLVVEKLPPEAQEPALPAEARASSNEKFAFTAIDDPVKRDAALYLSELPAEANPKWPYLVERMGVSPEAAKALVKWYRTKKANAKRKAQ